MAETPTAFLGTWQLVPGESKFEFDAPPRAATTRVMPKPDGLFFSVDWVDPKDKKGHVEHVLKYDEPTLVLGTEVTLKVLNEKTIETIVHKEGRLVSKTRRVILADGSMELTQTGKLPDGREVKNVSRYRKDVNINPGPMRV